MDIEAINSDPCRYGKKLSVSKLVSLLKKLSHHYYNTGEELVSDEVYDILLDILKDRDPSNKYLKQVGAPIDKEMVKLPYTMASLDKIKPDTDALEKWLKKYPGNYVVSDKLDGVSGLLIKDGAKEIHLYTRGDGFEGQDITHLIPYVVKTDLNRLPNGVAIRGELIISKNNFKQISEQYKNNRNAVAGLVNAKHLNPIVAQVTDFIGYSVLKPEKRQSEQMKLLEEWGFPTVEHRIRKNLTNEWLSEYLVKRRTEGAYEIDGLVVIDNSKKYKLPKVNPPYGFAFKTVLTDQIVEAKVLDIEWNPSKHGYLKPRVRIEPINLLGVTITYATAHNAKFIVDNRLAPGAIIKLVRSGDVIPKIVETVKSAKKAKMPDIPYKWNKTGVDLVVKDIHGAAEDIIKIKKLTNFFAIIGVKFLSEGIITKLVDNGYDDLEKILRADPEEVQAIDGIGIKLMTKIYGGIDEAFNSLTLPKLMAASGLFGRGFGEKRFKLIVNQFPSIMSLEKAGLKSKILEIEGFDTIMATQFIDNIDNFKAFFKKLGEIKNLSHLERVEKKDGKFSGQKFVFTGFRDKNLEQYIEKNGGQVSTSVSKNTSVVIYKSTDGAKYKKAVELGIKTILYTDFIKEFTNF